MLFRSDLFLKVDVWGTKIGRDGIIGLDRIIEGIDNSPLYEDIKIVTEMIIRESSRTIESMFESFRYKPLVAHKDWSMEITTYCMDQITPILREAGVSEADGTVIYSHIYAAILGEDVSSYL